MSSLTGGCLCGAVRYATRGSPFLTRLCHCETCRRANAAPVVAYICLGRGQVQWTGKRRFYNSTPGVTRGFCGSCGTQLHYMTTRWPGEVHICAATLDDPSAVTPDMHTHWDARLPWLDIADGLPKHHGALP